MERRIRWLGIAMVVCFVALFVQLNNFLIVKAHTLATSSSNPRVLALQRNDPRGDILSADGIVLASSVPSTSGYYKYQRVYNPYTSPIFSQIVGSTRSSTASPESRRSTTAISSPTPSRPSPCATCSGAGPPRATSP